LLNCGVNRKQGINKTGRLSSHFRCLSTVKILAHSLSGAEFRFVSIQPRIRERLQVPHSRPPPKPRLQALQISKTSEQNVQKHSFGVAQVADNS
jgi:hypothetical protein